MTDAATRPTAGRGPGPLAVGAGLALGLLTAMLISVRTSPDVDLYLHLRIGELLNAGGDFRAAEDPLASLADERYLPTQWLAQRAMSGTWAAAGMGGIQVVRVLFIVALGALAVGACRYVAPPTASGFAAALTMFGTAAAWGERPQLAGLVLFAAVTLLWWRACDQARPPWLVVPIIWLWACLHGSWLLGVAAGATILLGAVADRRMPSRAALGGVLTVAASVLAAGLTPLGPQVLTEPFDVARSASAAVNEWARPTLDNPVLVVVLVGTTIALVGVLRSDIHRWTRAVCLLAGLALSLWMVRTIAFGAVLMAPAVAHGLASVAGRVGVTGPMRREWVVWAIAAVIGLGGGMWHVAQTRFEPPLPEELDDALSATPPDAPLAVDGRAVGWVQFTHRDRRPMVDLRAEVFSPPVASAYRSFEKAEPGWQAYAEEQGIATIVTSSEGRLHVALEDEPGWSIVAEDSGFRVWTVDTGGAP